MTKVLDSAASSAAVDHLRQLATENGGRVPVDAVRAVAGRFTVTERTVWNWLRVGVPIGRSGRELSRDALTVIGEHHGNRRAAWRSLREAGTYDRSYVQFTRDV